MEVSWESENLWELFHNESWAKHKLGASAAKMLNTRWHELLNASNVLALTAGKPHTITGLKKKKYSHLVGQRSLRLTGGMRLVFRPTHGPMPKKETDWGGVTSVMITFVGDYH